MEEEKGSPAHPMSQVSPGYHGRMMASQGRKAQSENPWEHRRRNSEQSRKQYTSCNTGNTGDTALPQEGFPGGSDGEEPPAKQETPGSTSGSGRSPGEGNGNSLQYSCLGNPMAKGAWWATVHGGGQAEHMHHITLPGMQGWFAARKCNSTY